MFGAWSRLGCHPAEPGSRNRSERILMNLRKNGSLILYSIAVAGAARRIS
jgi:hypothetical protein